MTWVVQSEQSIHWLVQRSSCPAFCFCSCSPPPLAHSVKGFTTHWPYLYSSWRLFRAPSTQAITVFSVITTRVYATAQSQNPTYLSPGLAMEREAYRHPRSDTSTSAALSPFSTLGLQRLKFPADIHTCTHSFNRQRRQAAKQQREDPGNYTQMKAAVLLSPVQMRQPECTEELSRDQQTHVECEYVSPTLLAKETHTVQSAI